MINWQGDPGHQANAYYQDLRNEIIAGAVAYGYGAIKRTWDNREGIKLGWKAVKKAKTYVLQEPEKKMASGRGYKKRGFKRRRIGRRYGRRRGRGKGRMGRVYSKIRRINKIIYTKGLRNAEIKYITTTAQTVNLTTWAFSKAPSITFTKLANGNNLPARIGAKVFIRHIKYSLALYANASATEEQWIKWIIVRDTKPDSGWDNTGTYDPDLASIPKLGDVYKPANTLTASTTADGLLQLVPYADTVYRNSKRFQWLDSGLIKVNPNLGSGNVSQLIKKRVKVMKPCYYGDTTSNAGTENGRGQIYMWTMSNFTTNVPFGVMDFRLSYTDL